MNNTPDTKQAVKHLLDTDKKIWTRLMTKPYPDDYPENQKENPYIAATYLHDTLSLALESHTAAEVADVYKDECKYLSAYEREFVSYAADMNKVIEEHDIRSDWAKALRNVRNGRNLSYKIGFGFSKEDISELAKLHQKNKFRKKIESLLEDCNFHTENADFSVGNYDKYIMA